MASSAKVYVCGRCGEYGAPNLEDLVSHMTNCGVPEIRKKGESSHYEDNDVMFEDSDNSDDAIEFADISEGKESPKEEKSSLVSTHIFDADRTSPSPFLWSKQTALILLNLLKSHKADMESPYIRRKTVWQKIAMEMREKSGYSVTAAQCENKWKNMSNRYRKAKEINLHSDGKVKQTCFLYNELDEYFQSDARYQPRRDSMYDLKIKSLKQKSNLLNSSSTNINPNTGREPKVITIYEGEDSNDFKTHYESEEEPAWVKRMVETFERCHRENMRMQREFIDVLKKILEKK